MIEILQKQRQYFNTFQTYNVDFRVKKLKELKAKILEKRDSIFDAFKRDLNKHEFEAIACEIGIVTNEINYLIKNLKRLAEDRVRSSSIINYPGKNFRIFEPYGVTLVVSPWNYPFQLTMVPVIGAIAGGNTVVVKPSRNTPNVTKVIKQILSIFPEEYVYVVTDEEKINQLFDQKFDFVFYTGSGSVGKQLIERQAKYVTPMILELGGKCPCIVSKSANLKATAKRIAFGKFLNAGQTCVAPDFVLVDAKVKDKFIEKLIRYIKEFYYNKDGVLTDTFVRLINQKALEKIQNRINPSQIIFGGNVNGLTMEPTILDNVSFDDEIMQDEIFGPVLPIIVYNDLNEVITRLRTMPKPLALYYFGKNKKEGADILRKCPSGGGCINDVVMHVAEKHLPFGGVGESGIGSYHGARTFYAFVHEKGVLKRSTWFDFGKKFPPYTNSKVKFAKGIYGLKDKYSIKGSTLEEDVGFENTYAEDYQTAEQFDSVPEVQAEQVNEQEVNEQYEDVQDVNTQNVEVQDFDDAYEETIVPDGELELDENADAQEITLEQAEENLETPVEENNEELESSTKTYDEVKTTEEVVEEPTTEEDTPEVVSSEYEVDNDEIADIKEQTSTIDREPEDFEEDTFVENPEEEGDIEDVEDDFQEEEEMIEAIDAELKELHENEENDDDEGDAEQADTLVEDANVVDAEENAETQVEENLENPAQKDWEYVPADSEVANIDAEQFEEQSEVAEEVEPEVDEVSASDEEHVPPISEIANIALEQIEKEQAEEDNAEVEAEVIEPEAELEPQEEIEEVEEAEPEVEETEEEVKETEEELEVQEEDEFDDDEIGDDEVDGGDAEQADDIVEDELEVEEEIEEPEVEVVETKEEPKATETTNEVFKMLEEIEKETEESAEEVVEEPKEEAAEETDTTETTNEVFKMLEEIEKETEAEAEIEEAEEEKEVEAEKEVEPVVEEDETEVEEEEEPKKEEKPKKTTTKKTTKSTTKKSSTKKSTAKKTTKKKADDEEKPAKKTTTKKSSTKKSETTKKEKVEKAEAKEKKPTKRAVSKKVDARNDAQRAQEEINAMLNNMIPSSTPVKEDELEGDFLDSLNSLVSKNIDSEDEE